MERFKRPTMIAITGGIASGKSAVSAWLAKQGYQVVYSDQIGHAVLQERDVIEKLVNKFGSEILENGQISRINLGEKVFGNMANLTFLNSLTHPKIRAEMQKIADNSENEIIFYEIPLLYENGLADKFDQVINVFCPEKTKFARLKDHDNLDEAEAKKRIKSQLPDSIKKDRADINIDNNSTLEELYRQLEAINIYLPKLPKKDITRMV